MHLRSIDVKMIHPLLTHVSFGMEKVSSEQQLKGNVHYPVKGRRIDILIIVIDGRHREAEIPPCQALARAPPPRGDLTPVDPVDPETAGWDAAGNTLREIFSSAAAWHQSEGLSSDGPTPCLPRWIHPMRPRLWTLPHPHEIARTCSVSV